MHNKMHAFSLVEILVALVVVSLTAANMYGLQQKVALQQRDNINHVTAISIATREMEQVLSFNNLDGVRALYNQEYTDLQLANTTFNISWSVTEVGASHYAGDDFKDVCLTLTWLNSREQEQILTNCQQINVAKFTLDESEENHDSTERIIFSDVSHQEVEYFNIKKKYQTGAVVIYDSYLYQLSSNAPVLGEYPTALNERWISYGQIDKPSSF